MVFEVFLVQVANRINLEVAHFIHKMDLVLSESYLGNLLENFMGLGGAEVIVELMRADAQAYNLQQVVYIGLPAPIERDIIDRNASLEWFQINLVHRRIWF